MFDRWRRQTVGEIIRIASGQVDPKDDNIGKKVSVGPENLRTGGGIERHTLRTARDLSQISGKYAFDGEAILYSKIRPNLNKVGLPAFDGICSADVYPMWIKAVDIADRRFVYFLLTAERFVADASSRSFRTGLPKINRPDLESIVLDLPPLPEQRKIAEILRTWDEAIEKQETETTLKETAHSGYVKRLIHDPQYQRQRLRDHLQHVSNRNAEQKIERVLSVTNSAGFVLAEDQFAHRIASADLSNYRIVQRGQYAYNPARINVGSIARLDRWTDGVLSPMYVVFQVKPSLDSDFFCHWLSSAEARQRIRLAAQGSVRETVSFDDLGSISLPLPPLDRQRAVARFLNESQREIEILRQLTQKYQRQKRGLMQKLLTGEWRVKA